jgi:hypothetical protein
MNNKFNATSSSPFRCSMGNISKISKTLPKHFMSSFELNCFVRSDERVDAALVIPSTSSGKCGD